MKKFVFVFIPLLLFCLTSCNKHKGQTTEKTPGIQFVKGKYKNILAAAKEEQKPIFIDFYTSWCSPCKLMDEYTFSHPEVIKFYETNFINYKVDGEKGDGPKLIKEYFIFNYPSMVYLDADGQLIETKVGSAGATELIQLGQKILDKIAEEQAAP